MTVLTKEHVTGELPCNWLSQGGGVQNLSTCKAPQQLCLATCCCRLCREGGAKRLVGNATGWQRLKVARSLHQIGKATRDLALGDCCRSEEEVKAWHTQVKSSAVWTGSLRAPRSSCLLRRALTPPLNISLITNFGRLIKILLIGVDRQTDTGCHRGRDAPA